MTETRKLHKREPFSDCTVINLKTTKLSSETEMTESESNTERYFLTSQSMLIVINANLSVQKSCGK